LEDRVNQQDAREERITEYGWFYVTESGKRVEFYHNPEDEEQVTSEDVAKIGVASGLFDVIFPMMSPHVSKRRIEEMLREGNIQPLVRREAKTILSDQEGE
jgi:hypothetical protein